MMQEPENIKFVQINLRKRPVAHNALEQLVQENGISICLISEQNMRISTNKNMITDLTNHTCIWLTDAKIKVKKIISDRVGWVGIVTDRNILIISLYLLPCNSIEVSEVERILDDISQTVRAHGGRTLISGDFNAKSPGWGSQRMDSRGHVIEEWIAEHGLVILNDGKVPTYTVNNIESFIDLTACTDNLVQKVKKWKVRDDEESLSDHRFITFEYELDAPQTTPTPAGRWTFKKDLENKLSDEIAKVFCDIDEINAENLVEMTQIACDRVLTKKTTNPGKKPVYWWSKEIDELRKESIKKRRQVTRNRRGNRADLDKAISEYKDAKGSYTKAILEAKDKKWKKVCEEIDDDVFGLGYSIVTRKMTQRGATLDRDKVKEILETLFLRNEPVNWILETIEDEIAPFTIEELVEVSEGLRSGKAPGPDGILPEVVKAVVRREPLAVLNVMNKALRTGEFPAIWKIGKIVLLLKPGKPLLQPTSYRPLCLLNTYGKLLEGLLVERINKELGNNGLSPKQYGFRKGFSTIDPISEIFAKADQVRRMPIKKRKFCLLVALDVRNAFNSASWTKIIDEMKKKKISPYLIRMIQSYFKDRKIFTEEIEMGMSAGVPQGSKAGPLLWNILYDGVLRLKMPDGVFLIGYADDLAIVVISETEGGIQWKANEAIKIICKWMEEMELKLAPEKTEITWLTGRKHRRRNIQITVMNRVIVIQESLKYLGVYLDRQLTFQPHIDYVIGKASRSVNALARIMPRQGGAGTAARRVLNQVFESVILYAAPVWVNAMKTKKYRDKLITIQRKMLIKVSRAYRTTSTDALQIITGIPPIDLRVEQRAEAFKKEKEQKEQTKETMMTKWQERWSYSNKGEWTRMLIPSINEWMEGQHGCIDHYMIQILSGHGCFEQYLNRFKRSNSDACLYECEASDSAQHTLFYCKRWDEFRETTQTQLGITLTERNLIKTMIKSKNEWDIITDFVRKIMKQKISDEKIIKMRRLQENER